MLLFGAIFLHNLFSLCQMRPFHLKKGIHFYALDTVFDTDPEGRPS